MSAAPREPGQSRPRPPARAALPARVAGAPISWGVCEVPGWGVVLPVDTVLDEMAALGLGATELGPPGFLPEDAARLRDVLGARGLRLVGGFLALVLHDPGARAATLAEAERASALLAAAGADVLVLAAATGLRGYDDRPVLGEEQWGCLVATAARVRDVAAAAGLRTALHPHVGTHVETAAEVARLLASSDLPLCLDTGHLLVGGTDPLALARSHAHRVEHVHLKDVDAAVAARVGSGALTYQQAVAQGLYRPLGAGDVPVREVVRALEDAGYAGWYVLEQDTALAPGADPAAPARDVAASLAHLLGEAAPGPSHP